MRPVCFFTLLITGLLLLGTACREGNDNGSSNTDSATIESLKVTVEAENYNGSEGRFETGETEAGETYVVSRDPSGWLTFEVTVPVAGRYQSEVRLASDGPATVWLEDYHDNKDNRTYNITGAMSTDGSENTTIVYKDGSPLNKGKHPIKLHVEGANVRVDWFRFTLMREHQFTPDTLIQSTDGDEWVLAWSDEFDGEGLPDTSKWLYDIGNWGWGNNEVQYYTAFRTENARQEDGNLIIEARRDDMGQPWTSARLTTRGKQTFLYGRIEFRAKVPPGDGAWTAGWTLGDAYRDELSWPYCGEIDILECTGREIDDETGKGINHTSCHTRAYYFKQNNHITSTHVIDDMVNEYHLYAVEWMPQEIRGYVDGEHVFTYDETESEWAWPYDKPQNLIINIAMGGGMGGEIDPAYDSHKLYVDYVRIYERK